MENRIIAAIGFGEAAQAFLDGSPCTALAYDRKTDADSGRAAKIADGVRCGVVIVTENQAAVSRAGAILSLVTADQAMSAAEETASNMRAGAFFFDMNSVAPETKRAAAATIERADGRYVDTAIMAPVHPARRDVPLLLSGPHAQEGQDTLRRIGFTNIRVIDGPIGSASAIKMIRSIMVKGIEALCAECFLAADAAGVLAEVVASLDASWPGADWSRRGDYALDRMLVHGVRRAEEMGEVVKTIEALGLTAQMSRGTGARQREIGSLHLPAPSGLAEKIGSLRQHSDQLAPEQQA